VLKKHSRICEKFDRHFDLKTIEVSGAAAKLEAMCLEDFGMDWIKDSSG
jgi:hypothetical protein